MSLATLIHRASLPGPQVTAQQALELLQAHYGLSGTLHPLGSQQDLNYRLDSDQGRFVLKICRGDYAGIELEAQHAALTHLGVYPELHVKLQSPSAIVDVHVPIVPCAGAVTP